MKERPILFTPDNVRAILAGTKTQTRRVIKREPLVTNDGALLTPSGIPYDANKVGVIRCPYGAPGDVLWVREAWWGTELTSYPEGDPVRVSAHKATYMGDLPGDGKWRNAMFMPRWASRLTLRITEVRVERVQDISEDDAWAEAVKPPVSLIIPHDAGRRAYAALWDEINAKRGYAWGSNPWVWAITFEVLHG